jgi:hypothetical protein
MNNFTEGETGKTLSFILTPRKHKISKLKPNQRG